VQAVDKDNRIVPGYRGVVLFGTDNVGDTVPAPGKTVTFTADDNGEKKFPQGLIFQKVGKQVLYAFDINDDIAGQKTFDINEQSGLVTPQTPIRIDTSLELPPNTAPTSDINTLTTWELMHRTATLAGFTWIGEVSNYLTPAVYEGTPFGSDTGYLGQANSFASYLSGDPTTYAECLSSEAYLSYGLGERIEATDIRELRSIAKACAKKFYGKYFDGKPYTTREEYLMMLTTMFEEDISIPGVFSEDGRYLAGASSTDTGFDNVDKKAWFAPYLSFARENGVISPELTEWQVARPITDREAIEMLANYTGYRMGYTGSDLTKGMIMTDKLKYNMTFVSDSEVTIRVQ
jgi:hypothetical protein